MPVGCCGCGVDWGAVSPRVVMGISGHPACAVCSGFTESCLTLCPKRLVVSSCPRPGQPPQQCSQGQTSRYPSQDRILGPTPRPEGRRLAQRDRQPPGIPSTRAVCCLEGGQLIPGLGLCWAGWGSSCASPGQRLMEAPGLGGQAAV